MCETSFSPGLLIFTKFLHDEHAFGFYIPVFWVLYRFSTLVMWNRHEILEPSRKTGNTTV